jgi:hypothetical protein
MKRACSDESNGLAHQKAFTGIAQNRMTPIRLQQASANDPARFDRRNALQAHDRCVQKIV